MTDRQVELVIFRGDELIQRLSLSMGTLVFGRAEESDLCLADISVSRKHGQITVSGDEILFEDLGSGNGSWFKGQRVRSQVLEDGDEILVEPFRLQVEVSIDLDTATDAAVEGTDRTLMLHKEDVESLLESDYPEARIEAMAGEVNHNVLNLEGQLISLGRSEQRDLILHDQAASRLHCEIVPLKGSYWLRDSGSANGVQVNGSPISEHELTDGDIISIGETKLRYLCDDILGPKTDVLGLATEPEESSDRTEAFVNVMAPNQGWSINSPPAQSADEPAPQSADSPPGFPLDQGADPDATIEPNDPNAPPVFAPLGQAAPPPSPGNAAPSFGGGGDGIDYGIAPDLGDSPAAEWAFGGGLEPSADGSLKPKKAPGSGLFGNWVRTVIVFLLVSSVGLVFYKKLSESGVLSSEISAESQSVYFDASSSLDPNILARTNALMAEGQEAFRRKEYFSAFKKFFKTVSIDPTNEKAQRFQVLACEYVAVAKLQEKIAANEATASEKRDALNAGIDAARQALEKKASYAACGRALSKVKEGQKLNPGNEELKDLEKQIRSRMYALEKAGKVRSAKEKAAEMRPLLSSGSRNLSAGRYTNAISDFQRVMEIDPNRSNIDLYTQAEEGLADAKSQRRGAARRHYSDAAKYFNSSDSSDLRRARDFLKKALGVDKEYTAASTKLNQVMGTLRSRAKEEYDKGKVMLNASQYERARLHFQKVISLLDDPSESLYRRSKDEINAMGPG